MACLFMSVCLHSHSHTHTHTHTHTPPLLSIHSSVVVHACKEYGEGSGGQMLFSSWLWWLAVCGEFCSFRRRSVVSSGPFSVGVESAPRSVMVVVLAVAGGVV